MSWTAVAEKDFRDAIRSRLLIALTVLFALFSVGLAYFVSQIDQQIQAQQQIVGEVTTLVLISNFAGPVSIFIPIVAIAASYRAIAGERQSGSLKLLLSLPNDRLDVVAGKFAGRAGVVTVALLIGFAIGLVATALLTSTFSVLDYLIFVLVSLLLGFVYVSISVGVSAFTTSTSRAAYGSFGIFLVFQFLWQVVVLAFMYVANGLELPAGREDLPEWVFNASELLLLVNPAEGYRQGVRWVMRRVNDSAETQQPADVPFYAEDWFGFVFLALWIVVPLTIGYLRFKSSDL